MRKKEGVARSSRTFNYERSDKPFQKGHSQRLGGTCTEKGEGKRRGKSIDPLQLEFHETNNTLERERLKKKKRSGERRELRKSFSYMGRHQSWSECYYY